MGKIFEVPSIILILW